MIKFLKVALVIMVLALQSTSYCEENIVNNTQKEITQKVISTKPATPPLTEEEVIKKFDGEPTITQVRAAALEYSNVRPSIAKKWLMSAKLSAFVPEVGFKYSDKDTDTYYWSSQDYYSIKSDPDRIIMAPPKYTYKDQEATGSGWDLSLKWDLGKFLYSSDELRIQSQEEDMMKFREKLLLNITKIYYNRRKLQVKYLTDPPKKLNKKLELRMKIEELSAQLDAITNGYFSSNTKYTIY